MLQDPISKPPDVQLDVSRPPADRRHKANSNCEQMLKCPRCNSVNTKFCYYNNYSLTQPRHFCKNCRRYWTQGGSLRNVAVGGGCRKNKWVIKQRAVDPHSLVSLDESASSLLASLHNNVGAGSLNLSPSFAAASAPPTPGFRDLVSKYTDSHMLSMALSRLQESLIRFGEQACPGDNLGLRLISSGQLTDLMSNMLSSPAYETGLVYTSASVKPEHGAAAGGSELGGSLFVDPASHLIRGTLATPENQLTSVGGVPMHTFFTGAPCNLEAQLKLHHEQCHDHHQKQLAFLHLGEDHMHTQQRHDNTSASGPAVVETAANHHALPDFKDHESPESINNMMRRHHANKGKVLMGIDIGRSLADNWLHQAATNYEGANMGSENLYHDPVNASADHQSFWSHSPWTLAGSTAGALL